MKEAVKVLMCVALATIIVGTFAMFFNGMRQ